VTHGSAARRSKNVALVAALACIVAGACARTVQGGAPPNSPTVKDVTVDGASGVSEDDIVEGLATQPPKGFFFCVFNCVSRKLDRLAMEQDVSRIRSYYHRRGYFAAAVAGTKVDQTGKNEVKVTFEVREGKPTRITELAISGLPRDLADARPLDEKRAPLSKGAVFRYDRYTGLKDWLAAWLANRGYPHAIVTGSVAVDRDTRTAAVQIEVDVGPRARFGTTEIKGLDKVPASAIENRLAYQEGETFDPAQLALTQGRLYQLGSFGAVRLDYEKQGRPEVTGVTISVTEADKHEWRLGGGVALEGGFDPSQIRLEIRGRSDYVMRRFFHPLATLRIDLRPAWQFLLAENRNGPAGEATATVDRQDLFAPRLTGKVVVGYEVDEFEAYAQRGGLARLGLSRPWIGDRLLSGISWRMRQLTFYEQNAALDMETQAEIGMIEPYRVGALDQNLAFDLRDHPLDPSRGFFAQITASEGSEAFGGTNQFVRGTGDVRGYLPIGERLVLAARAMYGRSMTDSLPITERFFEGGANGHRGFTFRKLSPFRVGPEGEVAPIGGDEVVLTSGEVRFDLMKIKGYPFGVVGFADGGDVVEEVGDLQLSNLHWAGGIGFRYDPIVSLRLDFGYRLNRYGDGEPAAGDRFAFHFSLGQAF
jgi:translocation and assembly module TamA